jgi:hypothetical protein
MLPGTWPERSVLYARPNRGAETLRFSTGVTRARLKSQSSEAPRTPVLVPLHRGFDSLIWPDGARLKRIEGLE